MSAQLIGTITARRIPVFHARSEKPPKFRVALMQTQFSQTNFATSALRHEELVAAMMAQTVKPDLILFSESSLFGGTETYCDCKTVQAGKALLRLSRLAQELNVHIGFGTVREVEGQIYNSYAVVFSQTDEVPFFCDKHSICNPNLTRGGPYAYLAHFNAMVSICADAPLLDKAVHNGQVEEDFAFIIIPTFISARGTTSLLSARHIGFTGPIAVINHAASGRSVYSPDARSYTTLHKKQEEVLLVDVVA